MENRLKKPDLIILKDLHKSQVFLCDLSGKKLVYKEPRENEREYEVAEIVNHLVKKGYNEKFKVLILPKYFEINEKDGYLLMEYCGNNAQLKKEWESEQIGGGRDMDLRLSKEMAEIIYDFSKIKLKDVDKIDDFSFNFIKAKESFLQKLENVYHEGYINEKEFEKAKDLINKKYQLKRFIINNGDFYPRNLIPDKNKKVYVVDWQSWDNDYRANIIDVVENVAAFAFIHMWENSNWQHSFLKELRNKFFIKKDNFRLSLMLKSLDQLIFFGKNIGPAKKQLELFKKCLDDNWFSLLWKDTKPKMEFILKVFKFFK